MIKRISVTGPESTGKSWLAKKLATHFNTVCVNEFSVNYLAGLKNAYTIKDIEKIARGQLKREESLFPQANDFLFCDTDVLVNFIWSKVVFGEVPEWIEEKLVNHTYDLFLLCSPDLKWEEGSFRENPNDRQYLFKLYKAELLKMDANFRIVKGFGETRFKNASTFVNDLKKVN